MSNEFLIFDPSKTGMQNQSQYLGDAQRANGVVPGVANPSLHNKAFYQWSMMTSALGQFIDSQGFNASDVSFNDLVTNLTNALKSIGSSVGDIKWNIAPALDGWLLCNGRTIGGSASNATARANADTLALFTYIWNNVPDANATIFSSAGTPASRGATATSDFLANKAIQLPDMRGRVLAGLDNMGREQANRLIVNVAKPTTGAFNATTNLAVGGEMSHTQAELEVGVHVHGTNTYHSGNSNGPTASERPWPYPPDVTVPPVDPLMTRTTYPTLLVPGAQVPFNVVQPTMAGYIFIKM